MYCLDTTLPVKFILKAVTTTLSERESVAL